MFLPANFNRLAEAKCHFLVLAVLVLTMKLPLTTSAEVPVQLLIIVEFLFPFFFLPTIKSKHEIISERVSGSKFPVLFVLDPSLHWLKRP